MRKLLKYLKPYKKYVILGPAFKLVEAVFELIVPLVMAQIIDVGVKNADPDYVLRMGGLMVALSAIGLASTIVCQYFAAKASQGFGTTLRSELFAHINLFSHTELDTLGTPTLVTRITNDINQVQVGVAMFIRLAVRAPFLVIGATVMAMGIDLKISVVFIIAAAGIAVVLYLIMSRSSPLYTAVQKLLDRVSLLTRENLSGTRVIRAFSRQKSQRRKFDDASGELMRTQERVGRLSALLNPLTFLIVNAAIIAILWFGGYRVNAGALEQGQVIALVNYMGQILLALVVVANLVILFTRAGASAQRVAEVLDVSPSVSDGGGVVDTPNKNAPAVELRDVSFAYAGSNEYALEAIDLSFARGQTIGVIGGTGAGKSTLANLIPRFYDASKGIVLVDGEDVRRYTLAGLRAKIGVVPQSALLFSGSLRENMLWGNENATDEEILRALDAAQASEFVGKWQGGLDTHIQQYGRNLSGGQRQRLTIARALVRHPQILILDDSASALDFATDAALRRSLRRLEYNPTVILVSQRASALKNADQIVVLDDGRVSGVGTHGQLLETNETYREIYLSQVEEGGKKA